MNKPVTRSESCIGARREDGAAWLGAPRGAPKKVSGSALGEAGCLHGRTHRAVAVVHELGKTGAVGPPHAEAATGHEVAELGGLVDLLQRRRHGAGDVGRETLGPGKAAPGAGRVIDA